MTSTRQRYPSLSHWGAFTAVVENDRLVACEPFPFDPDPSPIVQSMPEMVHSPLRVQKPAVRKSWLRERHGSDGRLRGQEPFVEVSWEEALQLIHEELTRVRSEHDDTSIFGGSYGWSSAGRVHHARTQVQRFLNSGGGCVTQQGNYSWGTAQFLLPYIIGTYAPVTGRVTDWRNIIAHTRLFICFGGLPLRNTQITSGGPGQHMTRTWLEQLRAAGTEMVVISPNKRDIPEGMPARYIAIRPNTDTALMLAMMHTLITEDRHAPEFLQQYCQGYPQLEAYVLGKQSQGNTDTTPKTAEWAAAICGIDADTIRQLTRQAADTRTLLSCTWALQRAHRGEQPYWACIALAATLGQIGLPGGGFAFGHGSMNGAGNPRTPVAAPTMASLPNPTGCSIPVARLTDMLMQPGAAYQFNGKDYQYPDIRLVYWAGGNPFHHHQDLNRLVQAWSRPETIIVHESWWTPTARRADIVLPATTTLERNDIGGSSRDRFVIAMHQAVPPQGQSRNDYDIFRELAAMAGHETSFSEGRDEFDWIRYIYADMSTQWQKMGIDTPDFDSFWERGYLEAPLPERDFILFEEFRDDPQAHPLNTPSGRIELYSDTIASFGYEDIPGHPSWLEPMEWLGSTKQQHYPIHLVTHQPANKLHGQTDPSSLSRNDKIHGREPVLIHPDDARQRDIQDGDIVRLFNERGACLAAAVVTDDVMPGVAAMATGSWFDPQDDQLERHGNPNVLTRDQGTSSLAQGPSPKSLLIDIERWQGTAPDVQVFTPPRMESTT